MSQSSPTTPVVRGAQVTTEDGGRLNAFATEPRMEVVEATQGWGFHAVSYTHLTLPTKRIV